MGRKSKLDQHLSLIASREYQLGSSKGLVGKESGDTDNDGTFHGGFVRDRGESRGVRVARSKASEIPIADATAAQERVLARANPETAKTVMRPVQARRTKLACLGIPTDVLDRADPLYARAIRLANAYKKSRAKELFLAHGYVSSGVHALLASASLAMAASRFLYALTEEGGTVDNGTVKIASSLSDSARQNELAAWELCAREAVIRKRNESAHQNLPWLQTGTVESPSGQVKRGPGRPRKHALVQANVVVDQPVQEEQSDA